MRFGGMLDRSTIRRRRQRLLDRTLIVSCRDAGTTLGSQLAAYASLFDSCVESRLPDKRVIDSKQPFPCQLDLPCDFSCFVPAFAHTDCNAISQLNLFFHVGKWAGTMVRIVDTGKCVRAKIV